MVNPKYNIKADSIEYVNGHYRMFVCFNGKTNEDGTPYYEMWETNCLNGDEIKKILAHAASLKVDKSSPVVETVSPLDVLEFDKDVEINLIKK